MFGVSTICHKFAAITQFLELPSFCLPNRITVVFSGDDQLKIVIFDLQSSDKKTANNGLCFERATWKRPSHISSELKEKYRENNISNHKCNR
jgi:hypothetical protein